MVELSSAHLDKLFHALADPTRREILERLREGAHSVGELAAPCAMSLAAVSKHIRTLEAAGLVQRRVEGRTHRVRLEAEAMAEAHAWLERYESFWSRRLDALEQALRDNTD